MRDGYDWSVLNLGADPVPGDPAIVHSGGQQYVEVADAIGRSVERLRALDAGGSHVSEAVDALMDNARTVADSIARAEGRYRETGEALLEYAPVLMSAQETTLEAWSLASSARSEAADAERSRTYYLSLAGESLDPEQAIQYEDLATAAEEEAAVAAGRLSQAIAQTESAVTTRDQAAERAMGRIQEYIGGDGLNDSWWDNWGSDLLAAITDIAGWVATIAGVLALAVSWIPVVGQVLAAGLLVVAGVAAVVNAIGNTVLAVSGERTWAEAGMSILGAALSVVGLGAAARLVGRAATASRANRSVAAANRINARAGTGGTPLTDADAIALGPRVLRRSEALYDTPIPPPTRGTQVYRVYGDEALPTGASWSPTDPRTLTPHHRQLLGLPDVNSSQRLVIARIEDPSQVVLQRHALPYDGNPGGAAEYIIPPANQPAGITVLDDVVFRVP